MISGTRASIAAEMARQAQLSADIARGQTELSTNNRILAPSDDPAAAARVAAIGQAQANAKIWSGNLDNAVALAAQADTTLGNVSTALARAKEILLEAGSTTLQPSDRAALATELSGIAQDVAGYAQTQDTSGNPLFGTSPLQIPVGNGVTMTAADSAANVFGTGSAGDIAAALATAASAVSAGNQPAIATAMTAADGAISHIADVRAEQGVRAARIDAAKARLTTQGTALTTERAAIEEPDTATTIATIQAQLTTLQAAQATFVKINKQTLFDLLS